MTMTARYAGRCTKCGGQVTPGQQIDWDKATRAVQHITCQGAAVATGAEAPSSKAPYWEDMTDEARLASALYGGGPSIYRTRTARTTGICTQCGDPTDSPNHRLCGECYGNR